MNSMQVCGPLRCVLCRVDCCDRRVTWYTRGSADLVGGKGNSLGLGATCGRGCRARRTPGWNESITLQDARVEMFIQRIGSSARLVGPRGPAAQSCSDP